MILIYYNIYITYYTSCILIPAYIIEVSDCGEAYELNGFRPTVTVMKLSTGGTYEAECSAEGWTVIQSRGQFQNPKDYFLRDWEQYVQGFGIPGTVNYSAGCSARAFLCYKY